MIASFTGNVLHVDLSAGSCTVEHPPEAFYRKYGGGSGLGLAYILREVPPGADALGPENVLTFFTGPLTGLPISGQSRLAANARSPLGGAIGDSQAGGFFPAWLKFAGFDGLVIKGQAPAPQYLYLHDGTAELLDAGPLWGRDTATVDAILAEKHGKVEVAQIGPAGENLVRFAAIMNMHNRAHGRTGMGAVMGAKRLKAVVVQGRQRPLAADKETLTRYTRQGVGALESNEDMRILATFGTAGIVASQQAVGGLPSRNFNEGTLPDFEQLTGEEMADTILTGRDTCYACTVRCKRVVETEFGGEKVDPSYGGPEYESLATLGAYCGVTDLDAVALATQLCNRYGMDTISCGATIAFAMECFENGVLTLADTGGLPLHFGNAEAMVSLVGQIARREGVGDLLAQGTARAAQILGEAAADYALTVKGLDVPAHMPRVKKSLGLIYATNPFGADHQSSEHDPVYEGESGPLYLERLAELGLETPQPAGSLTAEKVRFAFLTQLMFSAMDTYAVCQFVFGPAWQLYGPAELVTLLRAGTGWDVDLEEVLAVGERRLNMMRAFNAREGFTREDDHLPDKLFRPLQGRGPTAGSALDPEEMDAAHEIYYRLAGWDPATGNPLPEKLASLGLAWLA